jgi:hypothetical protein
MLAELGDDWKTTVNLGHFRAYGCRGFVSDENVQRGDKFSSSVLIGKLGGYERGATNIFYVYVPAKGKVVRTSNVELNESRFETNADDTGFAADPDEDNGYIEPTDELYSAPVSTSSGGERVSLEELPTADNSEHDGDESEYVEELLDTGMPEPGAQTPPQSLHRSETSTESDPEDNITAAPRPRLRPPGTSNSRSERERTKSTKALANDAQGLTSYGTKRAVIAQRVHKVYLTSIAFKGNDLPLVKDIGIPQSYAEAISSLQADYWKAAMQSEASSLVCNDTRDLVDLLDHTNVTIVAGRWVFTVKANSEGLPYRFKARWVARGSTQRYGIDYDNTYASVTKPATVKIMLALVARLDMECKQ